MPVAAAAGYEKAFANEMYNMTKKRHLFMYERNLHKGLFFGVQTLTF